MSLLIKALQKAEQSKDAKATEKPAAKAGLSLELAPQEPKPEQSQTAPTHKSAPLVADNSGLSLSQTESAGQMPSPPLVTAHEPEPTLADEAGFSEPLHTPRKEQPPKVESAKVEPPKAEPARSPKLTKPVGKAIPGKLSDDTSPVSAQAPAEATVQRQAAASMLNLQPNDKKRAATSNQRGLWLGGAALLLLLVLGGGFYYYLQTLDQPQFVAVQPAPNRAPQAAPPQPTAQITAVNTTSAAPPAPETLEKTDKAEPAIIKPENKAETKPDTSKPASIIEPDNSVAEPRPTAPKAAKAPRTASASDPAPLQVARLRKGEPATNATHVAAYQAFTNGDDATAGWLYKQLLQAEPRNVDALLGLAAVAARQERLDEAASHYQHALEFDPKNSIAQAGLIALLGQANPTAAESRLKTLITQQPEAAYLHAALGGVYADQNQWPNAQQSYFQAFRLDSGSADYAFNLAVSLDQLNKPDLALNYYQRALDLLPRQPGVVDKAALETRIGQLRSTLGK